MKNYKPLLLTIPLIGFGIYYSILYPEIVIPVLFLISFPVASLGIVLFFEKKSIYKDCDDELDQ